MIDLTASPLIELRDVTLDVEGRRFLDGANLRVDAGETLVVTGAPGCGKSFVLRLLLALPGMGDIPVSCTGDVIVAGQNVFDLTGIPLQHLRRRIGFVMQGGGLIENMDVRRNISLPIQYHYGEALSDSGLADRRCDQLLDRFGLSHLGAAGLRPVALAHEQRVYVALARAMVADPFLLLLDDPASGLPPMSARRLCEHAFGAPLFADALPEVERVTTPTRVVTTADPSRYLDHGDRYILLDQGTLVEIGNRVAIETSTDPRLSGLLHTTVTPPVVDHA